MAMTTDESRTTSQNDQPTAELPLALPPTLVQNEDAEIWEHPVLPAEERSSVFNSLRGCA
jgi:hypothetical protein